jgi:ornithine carbamoyltransferase
MAEGASIPVINGLSDFSHPCQVMADLMVAEERLGSLKGKTVAWFGDGGDNVLVSWIHAAPVFGYSINVICPPQFVPPMDVLVAAQKKGVEIKVTSDIKAGAGADIVITDTWVSMHNSDAAARYQLLEPYRVNEAVMTRAAPDAIFLHCLPAHRGEEVTDEVFDGPQSVVFDEAENRVHAQKAIICWCLGIKEPR